MRTELSPARPAPAARPAEPLRVLHLVAPAGVGGLERVVHALAAGHARAGHQVAVAAVVTDPAPVEGWLAGLREAGVAVVPLVLAGRAYREERARVRELCRSLLPHVVHTHGFRPDVVDAAVARRLGVRCVTTLHGTTGETLRVRLYEWIQRRAARRFDVVVSVSRPLGTRLARSGVPAARLRVIPNAWSPGAPPLPRADARRALGIPEGRRAVGWVGRLSWEKGPDVALEALRRLSDPTVELVVVGDGPEREPLRAAARAAGIEDRVRWCGAVPDAARLFAAFDVWLLSSRTEGTPISLFEAIAAGVPVVATRVGGVPDVVGEEEALLVPPENPAAAATALRSALSDPADAWARARRAELRLHERFRLEPWLAAYEAAYRGEP